jgi:hypothetical protein
MMTMEPTVSRWLDRPLPVPDELPARRIELAEGRITMRAARRDGRSLRARGRFTVAGRTVLPVARVEVEIVPWSSDACEVLVRPVSRTAPAWGQRRSRRFYLLAHGVAEQLVVDLSPPIPLPIPRGGCRHGFGDQGHPHRPSGRGGVVGAA